MVVIRNFLNFILYIIDSFATFNDWFFNTSIGLGSITIYPYQIFGLSILVVIIGFAIANLVWVG